jgi:hypothetical protein
MINDIAQEILHDLFSSLEALEAQSGAILQFLKEKGIASDKELAVHFERAGNASSVRWRGVRARIDHLLSSALKGAEEAPKADQPQPAAETVEKTSRRKESQTSSEGKAEKETEVIGKSAECDKRDRERDKPEMEKEKRDASSGNRTKQEDEETVKGSKNAKNSAGSEEVPGKKTA